MYSYKIEAKFEKLRELEENTLLTESEMTRKRLALNDRISNYYFIFNKAVSNWVRNAVKKERIEQEIFSLEKQYLQ